ncbi:LOW QUALITY PROTEIN: CAP-Gly domain-containing linker protein 1-like [Pecten maximus]|uniref:LOW QUALITY PROTEIN: CAP-Gly domain-containing linker protein 1-like n=1 Tax=Pecten maximus TaxID=6579 RepID=UPI001459038A|nr:LOW QUALITY PROTEIN: CAP-Gly domain-containing linker protein 1-like [Pecten maximus]
MSLPRPSGLKAPSKIGKPSGMPTPRPSGTSIPTPGSVHKVQSAIAKSARAAGISAGHAEKYAADVVYTLKGPELPNPPPPADDFIIGDRIWVSGNKPGFIAFLGETQFAPGEWAGIVLDKFDGKNDGSVQGVRYFQCEAKRGVFARISKLSRTPNLMQSTGPRPEDNMSESGQNSVKATPNGSHMRPTTPKIGLTASRGPLGSTSSLSKAPMSLGGKPTSAGSKPVLKIGDRVLVSGTKMGTLRYVGFTDFAKGDWAGVELDEKQGKNDGAVAGKRYFDCRPMYGLFAPLHKVTRLTSGSGPGVGTGSTTPSPQARSLMNTSLRLSREKSGSQESVSSISSSASSVSRSRVRLGVTSLSNQLPLRRIQKKSPSPNSPAKTSQRPSTLNLSATTTALQKALKEKEEHIEQLLRERDLERAEVARAAAHVDEAEGELTTMRVQNERLREDTDDAVIKLKTTIQQLEKEKAEFLCKLEDEKRKVEDLQFQIEEEAITKDDLESRTEEEEAKLKDLEKSLRREKERADKFEQELFGLKALLKDKAERLTETEDQNIVFLDQIEELTHKVSQAENKVKGFESSRLEEGAKTSQVSIELEEKATKVTELEDTLSLRNREVKELQNKLSELNEEVKTSTIRRQKLQETIDNLSAQLANSGDASNSLNTEIQNLKSQMSDLQRKLDSSKDKEQQLTDEKNQLELQMSDMMRNSGDSSKRLSLMNDQLTERNRKIQELQTDLSNSTQKWGRINDQLTQLQSEREREKENLISKHEENINTFKSQIEDMQRALDKANNKMKTKSEDFEKEKEEAIQRKQGEINSLKKQLEQNREELDKQEVQTQAHKRVLDTITIEKDALQFEKEKAEKQVKRLEAEKETLNGNLIHARVEVTKTQSTYEKLEAEHKNVMEQISDLKSEIDKSNKSKKELQKQKDDIQSEKDAAITERESLQREVIEGKVTLQQKDMQIEELQKKSEDLQREADKLRMETSQHEERISQLSEQESTTGELQTQLEENKDKVVELQQKLKDMEGERDSMKAQLEFSNLVAEERKRLEDQNVQLSKDVETLQTRFSKELEKHDAAKTSLQTELDNSSQLLQQKSEEVETYQKQIANLKNENSSLEVYRSSVSALEEERLELRNVVKSLEQAVKDAKAEAKAASEAKNAVAQAKANSVAVTGDALTAKLQEEKAAVEGQVDFLNSVIVDLQKKNSELKIRLEAMEVGAVTNGNSNDSMEVTPKAKAPPRLFCDICDVFDEHDTDDCPMQAMDYEEPPPSQHHGDRKHMRSYCDICEEFHEPCVLPEGIVDDVLSPIKVNITHAQDFDKGDGHPETTSRLRADESVYKHGISEDPPVAEDTEMEQGDEHDDDNTLDLNRDKDAYEALLKPEDPDAQYISDEDLIEKGDFVKGEREFSDEYPHESEEKPTLSDFPGDIYDDNDDKIIESSDKREGVDDELDDSFVDDSVDEFLELEKQLAAECEQADSGVPSDVEHGLEEQPSGYDEYMQAMQDLSSQKRQKEKNPSTLDEVRHEGKCGSEDAETHSEPTNDQTRETPTVKLDNDDSETQAVKPKTVSDAVYQQENYEAEGNINSVANDDVIGDDSKNVEMRGHPSVSSADFHSGNESVNTDIQSDVTRDDEVESEDDVTAYECASDVPEGTLKQIGDETANLAVNVLKDDDIVEKIADNESQNQEECLDPTEEQKEDVSERDDETQGTEMAGADMHGLLSDDKDEKCKIS